ncbi:ABC transporter permease [Streptosporangium fragile]|uniref:ABC transporter permease n=1 Tax=Streptosporangium fragile TaxID=46186 RepID=A0ABP6INM8_9ACTN
MRRQILGHAARAVSTLLIVLVITFAITRIAYRNPAAVLAPRNANQQTLDGITRALRLDEPWYLQLWHYLYRGPDIQGAPMGLFNWPPALGYSFRQQRPVTELILSKVPVTLSLALGALVIWMTLSILLGVLAARKPGTWVDRFLSALSYAGLSVPTFLSGILLSYFLYFKLSAYGIRWFPSSGYVGITEDPVEWARHLALPWLTIAIAEIGIFQRVVRGNMLDVLGSDYIRTARAKGVSERRVHFDHALKAALNPIITLSGLELAAIMGGAIVTEQIFGLDGVGRLAVEAAVGGDFPVVIGTTVLAAAIFVISTFVVDVITHLRDPAGAT